MKNKLPVTLANAQYRTSDVTTFSENLLILALPTQHSPSRFKQALSVSVTPTVPSTSLNESDRITDVKRFRSTRLITTQHLELYNEIYEMMSQGYIDRNPSRPEVVAWTYDVADSSIALKDIERPIHEHSNPQTTADALFVTGISGNGKSTAINMILSQLFPTLIEHHREEFSEPQIVYVKVDMPHDANRSALIYRILLELDRIISQSSFGHTIYASSVKKENGGFSSIATMEGVLWTALVRHHVGLLVIDEFQNLQVASQRYRDQMLQFFDALSNQVAVPTLKIGTPDSIFVFDKKGRHKRRIGATFELSRFQSALDCDRILDILFSFQPLTQRIERNQQMSELLLELTAGVPSILMTLWEACLIEAIRSGKEKLTLILIKSTFRKRFPLMRTVTRNINQGKKGQHADLLTVQHLLNEGNKGLAIKHLDHFSKSAVLGGEAAQAMKEDIDTVAKSHQLSDQQRAKLAKIKANLDQQRQVVRQPQTFEHKA